MNAWDIVSTIHLSTDYVYAVHLLAPVLAWETDDFYL